MYKAELFKELFDLQNFYNCKHQELKSRFHSFAANNRIDCLLFVCQVLCRVVSAYAVSPLFIKC